MISHAFKGFSHVFNGFRLIKMRGVKRFVVIPTLINFILFSTAFWFGYAKLDQILEQNLPKWLNWLEFIIWPLIILASLVIVFFVFTIVANLLGAPFNSVLAEKIEQQLTDKTKANKPTSHTSSIELLKSAGHGIRNELSKLFYIVTRAIPLLLIYFIPGLNAFAPIIWFLFGAWMLAIEYLDYPMGNCDMSFKQQLTLIKKNRFLCLGLGAAIMFMTIVPGLNFFAMPVGVAAATSLWSKDLQQHAAV